jgi:uncharacterized protein YycO
MRLTDPIRRARPKKRRRKLSAEARTREKERIENRRRTMEFNAKESEAINAIHSLVGAPYDWTNFNRWAAKNDQWKAAEGIPYDDETTWQFILKALKVFLKERK